MTENEQKKEFLMGYQVAKRDVIRSEEQLTELRNGKMSPSSMIGDDMPHAHNTTDLSDYAARVDEIERNIVSARYKRIQAFKLVQNSIEKQHDTNEKNLLTYRYLRGMKWEEICVAMGYSWKQIHRIHARSLKNFEIMT